MFSANNINKDRIMIVDKGNIIELIIKHKKLNLNNLEKFNIYI